MVIQSQIRDPKKPILCVLCVFAVTPPTMAVSAAAGRGSSPEPFLPTLAMHYDAHQPVIDDLEARITTIRDSL